MSVYKRNGKWYIYATYQGIRYRKKTNVLTKREANLVEGEFRRRLELSNIGLYNKNIETPQLIEQYLTFKKEQSSKNTFRRDRSVMQNFLRHVKPKTAMEITPSLLDTFVGRRKKDTNRGRSISARTINIEITSVKAMLNWAIKRGLISHNPIKDYKKLPSPRQTKLKYISLEDVSKLLVRLSPTMYPVILTFLKTGLRRNELINLKWADVDFENKVITVRAQDVATGHHSKTYEERYIPVDDEILGVLKSLRRKSNNINENIFCTKDGKPRTNNLLRELKRQAKSIGITSIDLHTLRHTYASHLRMAGADLEAVGKLLGHKDPKTTKIYEHLTPGFLKKTVELLPIKYIQSRK